VAIGGAGSPICQWITDHGGVHGIDFSECWTLIQAYIAQLPPPPDQGTTYTFVPSFNDAFGTVLYWLGDYAGGNTYTGCGT
jgi:hypothetical protein